jgi:hypothetical protein
MADSVTAGPSGAYGQSPPTIAGGPPADYNPDRGFSFFDLGVSVLDPRFGWKIGGAGGGSVQGYIYPPGVNVALIDQVPSAIATANIAALANVANGTPMVLVSVTGAGITVMTAAYTVPMNGNVVPACLAIDGLPGIVTMGQSGSKAYVDPTKAIARAVSITGVAGGSGGHFLVAGFDLYGQPQTENINASAGAVTTNGKKAFKFVQSVTPLFADAHNYSVGTTDIYGLPWRADVYGYVNAAWNNAAVTSPTFVAADTTSPATATTGDVRGTIVAPSASDGTKRLQVMMGISPANANALTPTSFVGMFGVTPA